MRELYKFYKECKNEKEQTEIWLKLVGRGYKPTEINRFNYVGNDGKFHREIFVFND